VPAPGRRGEEDLVSIRMVVSRPEIRAARRGLVVGLAAAVGVWPAAMAVALPAPPAVNSPQPSTPSGPVSVVTAVGPLLPALPVNVPVASPAAPAAGAPAPRASAAAGGTLTVQPDTNLTDGQNVTVTGSGMKASSYGSVLECNLTDNEPTVQVEGNAVPVGCTDPLKTIQSTDASGAFTRQFTVHTGTIGPPGQGTDSAGQPASSDAAKYPCPPTPAQQASGSTCDIVFGDTGGDANTTPITFASSSSGGSHASGGSGAGSTSTTGAGGSASATSAGAGGAGPSTASGSSTGGGGSGGATLPFTGFGQGMLWLTRLGAVFGAAGALLLMASGATAQQWWARRRRATGSAAA